MWICTYAIDHSPEYIHIWESYDGIRWNCAWVSIWQDMLCADQENDDDYEVIEELDESLVDEWERDNRKNVTVWNVLDAFYDHDIPEDVNWFFMSE